jgi:two-component system, NarL family, sensor kinase
MKKLFLYIVVSFAFTTATYSQNTKIAITKAIDSLRVVLKTEPADTNRTKTLNTLSIQLFTITKFDTALQCANDALTLSDKLNFKKGSDQSYRNIGKIYLRQGKLPEALKNESQAFSIAQSIDDKTGMCDALNNIGVDYYSQGKYDSALKSFTEGIEIAQEIGQKRVMGSAYSNIGNIYLMQGKYPEALKNYLQAQTVDEEIGFKVGLGDVYGNIGIVYYSEGNYPDAIDAITKSLKIEGELGNKVGTGNAYINLGDIYLIQNKNNEALENFQHALKITTEIGNKQSTEYVYNDIGAIYILLKNYPASYENSMQGLKIGHELKDNYGMGISYTNIGVFYREQKQYAIAGKYLDSAIAAGELLKNNEILRDANNAINQLDSSMGDYKGAYIAYRKFITYRDSIKNDENTKKITTEQMNYDFEQKETKLKAEQDKQNVISEEKLKRQKLITWAAGGTLGFILLLSLLLFNRSRLKQKALYQQQLNQKQKEQAIAVMETQEQERKRIAEDLHDSLGHLLSTIKINLQASSEAQKQNFKNSLELLQQASSEIHNITFNLMPLTLEEEGLIPALNELAGRITNSGNAKIILYLHEVEGLTLEKQTQFTIYRIIQEAVNNILKYAESKEINIQLLKQENQLVIMIEDDGKGFNMKEVKKGRGLKNMMARSAWLNGKLAIDSGHGHGTTITVEIPL